MTTIERFDDGTGSYVEIQNYSAWRIESGVSDVQLAPKARLELPRTSPVSSGTRIRITENGTVAFEGNVVRTQPRTGGPMRVDAEHDAYGLFEETVSLSRDGTDEEVLNEALSQASGSWTLSYDGLSTILGDTYEVDGRTIKRVFRDMVERVGRIWWVDVDHTITVAELGAGGNLASVDTSTDPASVSQFTPDDVDTVVNDVVVVGTGAVSVTGTASDAGSISDYGRQPERVNVSYITSTGEAADYADALLNPEPDASATARVGASVVGTPAPVVNQTLDVTDAQGTGLDDVLPIEKQTVTQGSVEFELGEGAGVNTAKFNRREKSKNDVTEPGSVYDSDRIADGSILSDKLFDSAVTEQKLADLSVSLNKVQPDAINETKIQDDSISTPKLQAGSVIASKILADTITANEIAAGTITALEIAADTITANNIAANTLTADLVDTFQLNTSQLTIGEDADPDKFIEFVVSSDPNLNTETNMRPNQDNTCTVGMGSAPFRRGYFQETVTRDVVPRSDNFGTVGNQSESFSAMWAYDFFDADTGTALSDGGDPLRGLADGQGPPDHAAATDENGEVQGYSLNRMARYVWDVVREQQRKIEGLESRLEALESASDPNA